MKMRMFGKLMGLLVMALTVTVTVTACGDDDEIPKYQLIGDAKFYAAEVNINDSLMASLYSHDVYIITSQEQWQELFPDSAHTLTFNGMNPANVDFSSHSIMLMVDKLDYNFTKKNYKLMKSGYASDVYTITVEWSLASPAYKSLYYEVLMCVTPTPISPASKCYVQHSVS